MTGGKPRIDIVFDTLTIIHTVSAYYYYSEWNIVFWIYIWHCVYLHTLCSGCSSVDKCCTHKFWEWHIWTISAVWSAGMGKCSIHSVSWLFSSHAIKAGNSVRENYYCVNLYVDETYIDWRLTLLSTPLHFQGPTVCYSVFCCTNILYSSCKLSSGLRPITDACAHKCMFVYLLLLVSVRI